MHKVKKIMKILNHAYSHFGPIISISKTRNRALNNKELAGGTPLLAFVEIFWRTYKNLHICICTGSHVSKVIGKFIEIRQLLTYRKVNMATKVKRISSFIWNGVYEWKNALQNLRLAEWSSQGKLWKIEWVEPSTPTDFTSFSEMSVNIF